MIGPKRTERDEMIDRYHTQVSPHTQPQPRFLGFPPHSTPTSVPRFPLTLNLTLTCCAGRVRGPVCHDILVALPAELDRVRDDLAHRELLHLEPAEPPPQQQQHEDKSMCWLVLRYVCSQRALPFARQVVRLVGSELRATNKYKSARPGKEENKKKKRESFPHTSR